MIPRQVRQGDVLLHPIDSIPSDAKPVETRAALVLATGEATGHAHRIEQTNGLRPFRHQGILYLEVGESVELIHDTHSRLVLEPGKYVVLQQVEQWLDDVRRVLD